MPDDLALLGVISQIEARIWRDALGQESIPVFIRQANPLAAAGFAPAIGDVHVYVRAGDEKRARWIIGDHAEPGDVPAAEAAPRHRRQRARRTTGR